MLNSTARYAGRLATFLPVTKRIQYVNKSLPRLYLGARTRPISRYGHQLSPFSTLSSHPAPGNSTTTTSGPSDNKVDDRQTELEKSGIEQYPRLKHHEQISDESNSHHNTCKTLTLEEFSKTYNGLDAGSTCKDGGKVAVYGRIKSIRTSSSKLSFLDLTEGVDRDRLQIMLNLSSIEEVDKQAFVARVQLLKRGDVIAAKGYPCRTKKGELSLHATALPAMLSPRLHIMPTNVPTASLSPDSDLLDRHVEMLADETIVNTLRVRSRILNEFRAFFTSRGFEEVQTPILAAAAGGATARPFETTASEFADRKLSLRIAPELWLKRLVIGGMSRIFEIGPSFRNEGIDKTHNPEFTTCEFYAAYHTLPQLQEMTELLLRRLCDRVAELEDRKTYCETEMNALFHSATSFRQIDFIPAINAHLPSPLPNLASPEARIQVLEVFKTNQIPVPSKPTLPRLLDKLCSHYIEPHCISPTWIVNTPECLSPLAKSFIHPTAPNAQPVAARAELFIKQSEYVNCYEEENSPHEQRRKFIEQQKYASIADDFAENQGQPVEDDEAMHVDECYLRALEWGLPPTGGWGCGIDRLVMLFAGKDRIGDVLSFGNLRAVTRGAEKR